jgi:hypothetical protein
VVLILLAVIAVGALIAVPGWLLWRIKRQWRYPVGWLGVVIILLGLAAASTILQLKNFPTPVPIHETLSGVTDQSGDVIVTGLRLPDPTVRDARIEVDVENASTSPVILGLQYIADGGNLGSEVYSPGSVEGARLQAVEPSWSGTMVYDVTLPGFAFGGNIVIVLALCPDVELDAGATQLPPDSEALYQHHFDLVPVPE